ncbi:hypothetical protein ACFTY7_03775 [Streptomyces sp. NPDC057062]|uniref:hypothetical protein n=1 Tax=Streptomyces sp. NPDC057062 TaxID=3346011 RepID=UPI0036456099
MAGDKEGKEPKEPGLPALRLRLREELGRIDEQLRALLAAMDRLQGLLDAGVAISREMEWAPPCCSSSARSAGRGPFRRPVGWRGPCS